jgi:hypothetical protein
MSVKNTSYKKSNYLYKTKMKVEHHVFLNNMKKTSAHNTLNYYNIMCHDE